VVGFDEAKSMSFYMHRGVSFDVFCATGDDTAGTTIAKRVFSGCSICD
jgi:hypothetical protein